MNRMRYRAATLLATALLAGCASSHIGTTDTPQPGDSVAYPVAVTSCGVSVTYDQAPRRAVSNDINTTEDMLALGLESRMAGDGPEGKPVPAQYQAGFGQVRDVSPSYFTLESLVGLKPDFLFAGWNYGLQTGTSLTPDNFTRYGIKTLVLAESCAHVPPGPNSVSINDTYQDLPVTVFDYDSGQSAPFTGPGLAMPTALITLGGGTNIFGSLRQSWTSVSWEQVVRARPRCIIINDYGTPTAAQKEKFLETSPVTRNLPAVRNRCFLPLAYDEVTPGPRNAEAVVAIARWLPPTSFGRAADGS